MRLASGVLFVAFWPAVMFLVAGDLNWTEGWLFTFWLLGLYAIITSWMYLKNPELLAERRRQRSSTDTGARGHQSASDRRAVSLLFLGFAVWIVTMPLDARRVGWTPPFPLWLKAIGGGLLLLSAFLLFRSFYDNTFLSGAVRIQSDRRQHVVTTGVYSVIRHPMYLGIVLMFVGASVLLGSSVGLVIAVAMVALLAARIGGEEQLLSTELEGYEEYQRTVRYRLLPLIW